MVVVVVEMVVEEATPVVMAVVVEVQEETQGMAELQQGMQEEAVTVEVVIFLVATPTAAVEG